MFAEEWWKIPASGRNAGGGWVFGASGVGQIPGFGLSRERTQTQRWAAAAVASWSVPLGEPNSLPIAQAVVRRQSEAK